MTFTYSICHPDKQDIEHKSNPISGREILEIAEQYPWKEKLSLMSSMNEDAIHYSPSLNFTCIENEWSFGLTADTNNDDELTFSLWYNRSKKVNILFGLLGSSHKMTVDDFWSLDLENSLLYLKHFVKGNYALVEALYKS